VSAPRRTIALGLPYDDGTVPKEPMPMTDDERLDRIERHLERLDDSLRVLIDLRKNRGETVEDIIEKTAARIGPNFDGHFPPHNTILRDGPGDGMLIAMAETTHTIVWDSPWRPPEPGEYRRTDDVEDGRAVFRWASDA
jgi:hypothetical protein